MSATAVPHPTGPAPRRDRAERPRVEARPKDSRNGRRERPSKGERAPDRRAADRASKRARRSSRRRLKVVEARRLGTRHVPFYIMATLLVAVLVVAIVSTQALVSQTSFHMEVLAKRADRLQREYGRLRLDVAKASSPARIEEQARHLGLGLPEQVQTISVPNLPTERRGRSSQRDANGAFAVKAVLGGDP